MSSGYRNRKEIEVSNKYRKPRFHVVGMTALLLKGFTGNVTDVLNSSAWFS